MSVATTEQALAPAGTTVIDRGVLPTTEVIARVHRIQEVMKALMRENIHYGVIPGTPKPTLYKPGAELLLMTFRIAATPALIEDLSTADEVRYRVTMRGTNQITGEVVGEMVGECSSSEMKYRWRKPVCEEEFIDTDPSMRREVWKRGSSGAYKEKQVRTSPADVANTILKMAVKRGLIALTLSALAASDIFAQDLEDLAEELRESIGADATAKPDAKQPQRRSQTGNGASTPKPSSVPADAKVIVGTIKKVWPPDGERKPYAIQLKEDPRRFTTFNEAVAKDAQVFEGTDHRVKLAYTEQTKDGRTFYNPVGIAIADAEPATPAGPALHASDIFGGAGREPGEDDA